jgi:hypothetical protein
MGHPKKGGRKKFCGPLTALGEKGIVMCYPINVSFGRVEGKKIFRPG